MFALELHFFIRTSKLRVEADFSINCSYLFLMYNQKYCSASLLNNLYEIFYLCSCSWKLQMYMNKHEAKCSLQTVLHLLLFCSLL